MRKLIFNIFLSFFSAFAGCPKFRKRACTCESGKKSGGTRSSFILEKHDIKFYKYPLFVKTRNLFFWYIFRKRSKKRGRLFFLYLVKSRNMGAVQKIDNKKPLYRAVFW